GCAGREPVGGWRTATRGWRRPRGPAGAPPPTGGAQNPGPAPPPARWSRSRERRRSAGSSPAWRTPGEAISWSAAASWISGACRSAKSAVQNRVARIPSSASRPSTSRRPVADTAACSASGMEMPYSSGASNSSTSKDSNTVARDLPPARSPDPPGEEGEPDDPAQPARSVIPAPATVPANDQQVAEHPHGVAQQIHLRHLVGMRGRDVSRDLADPVTEAPGDVQDLDVEAEARHPLPGEELQRHLSPKSLEAGLRVPVRQAQHQSGQPVEDPAHEPAGTRDRPLRRILPAA